MNNHIFSDYDSSKASFWLEDLRNPRSCNYYDNVFMTSRGQEKDREIMQDWCAFGIIDPLLLSKTLNQALKAYPEKTQLSKGNQNEMNIPQFAFDKNELEIKYNTLSNLSEMEMKAQDQQIETQISQKSNRKNRNGKRGSKAKPRLDSEIKQALRFVKKFMKKLFKSLNIEITNKRYINCTPMKIFEAMKTTLMTIIPDDLLADDLIYYTIGILNLKKPSELRCKQRVKKEISIFKETNSNFTYKRLKKSMQSSSLRILCRFILLQASDQIGEALRKALGIE
ncbi:unnamed protein product [Moneuplotes crassus]|uniref:Uncharacterized protein n=1 Tax=Euplotes crassus TaxID=5936 RepID=A0AAD1Y5X0_EUPCR|nr:unnamed protein product [Moneuplotes crassus]